MRRVTLTRTAISPLVLDQVTNARLFCLCHRSKQRPLTQAQNKCVRQASLPNEQHTQKQREKSNGEEERELFKSRIADLPSAQLEMHFRMRIKALAEGAFTYFISRMRICWFASRILSLAVPQSLLNMRWLVVSPEQQLNERQDSSNVSTLLHRECIMHELFVQRACACDMHQALVALMCGSCLSC